MWKILGKGDWVFLGVWKISEFFVCTLHPGSLGELEKPDLANTASLMCSTPAVVPALTPRAAAPLSIHGVVERQRFC